MQAWPIADRGGVVSCPAGDKSTTYGIGCGKAARTRTHRVADCVPRIKLSHPAQQQHAASAPPICCAVHTVQGTAVLVPPFPDQPQIRAPLSIHWLHVHHAATMPTRMESMHDWRRHFRQTLLEMTATEPQQMAQAFMTLEASFGVDQAPAASVPNYSRQRPGMAQQGTHSQQPPGPSVPTQAELPSSNQQFASTVERLCALERRLLVMQDSTRGTPGNMMSIDVLSACAHSLNTIAVALQSAQNNHTSPSQSTKHPQLEMHMTEDWDINSLRSGLAPTHSTLQHGVRAGADAVHALALRLWAIVPAAALQTAHDDAGFCPVLEHDSRLLLLSRLVALPARPADPQQLELILNVLMPPQLSSTDQPSYSTTTTTTTLASPSRLDVSPSCAQDPDPTPLISTTQLLQVTCSLAVLTYCPSKQFQKQLLSAWQQCMEQQLRAHTYTAPVSTTAAANSTTTTNLGSDDAFDEAAVFYGKRGRGRGGSMNPNSTITTGQYHIDTPPAGTTVPTTIRELVSCLAALTLGCSVAPPRTWLRVWAHCITKALPAATPGEITALLQLLARLPENVMDVLGSRPMLWTELWKACWTLVGIVGVLPSVNDDTSQVQSIPAASDATATTSMTATVLEALRAAGRLRQVHGVASPSAWVQAALQHVISTAHAMHAAATPSQQQTAPVDISPLLHAALKAMSSMQIVLPKAVGVRLLELVVGWLPGAERPWLSKVFPLLPGLAKQVPRQAAARLRRTMLSSMLCVLRAVAGQRSEPSRSSLIPVAAETGQAEMANTFLRAMSSMAAAVAGRHSHGVPQHGDIPPARATSPLLKSASTSAHAEPVISSSRSATPEPFTTAVDGEQGPLEAWELSGWLKALSWAEASAGGRQHLDRQVQSTGEQIQGVAALVLIKCDARVLRTAEPQMVVEVMEHIARLRIRPSDEWLIGMVAAADARCLEALPPTLLVTLCWASARLGLARMAPYAWLSRLHALTNGCMETLSLDSLAQVAWSMSTMQRQAATVHMHPQRTMRTPSRQDAQCPWPMPKDVHASWLLHVLRASAIAARTSKASGLAAVMHAVVDLMQNLEQLKWDSHAAVTEDDATMDNACSCRAMLLPHLADWAHTMVSAFLQRLPSADARAVSDVLWSTARICRTVQDMPAVNAAIVGIEETIGQHASQDAGSLYSALPELANQGMQRLHELTPIGRCGLRDLSVSFTALSDLSAVIPLSGQMLHQQLHLVILTAAQQPEFSQDAARDLSSVLLAVSRLPHAALVRPAMPLQDTNTSVTVPSLSDLVSGEPSMVVGLVQAFASHMPAADAGALASTWLALGRLRFCPDRETLGALLLACHRQMHRMSAPHVRHVVWALGRLRLQPGSQWLDRLQLVVYKAMQRGQVTMQARAGLLWAAARCGWHLHGEFVPVVMPGPRTVARLGLLDMAMFCYAGHRLGLRPGEQWVMVLLMASAKRMAQLCAAPATHSTSAIASDDHAAHQQGLSDDQVAKQLGRDEAGQLVMLGDALRAWHVAAPLWWWAAWVAVATAATPRLDLHGCSLVLRVLARQPALLHLWASQDGGSSSTTTAIGSAGLATALHELMHAVLQRSQQLMATGRPQAQEFPACAVLLYSIVAACLAWEHASRSRQSSPTLQHSTHFRHSSENAMSLPGAVGSIGMPGVPHAFLSQPLIAQVVEQLFHHTQGRLYTMPPSYVTLMVTAAAVLHKRTSTQGGKSMTSKAPTIAAANQVAAFAAHVGGAGMATGSDGQDGSGLTAGGVVPAVWREEVVTVLEMRDALLTMRQQYSAKAAMKVLQPHS